MAIKKPSSKLSTLPPSLPAADQKAADAFVNAAPVQVAQPVQTAPVAAQQAASRAGRPRKYTEELKPLTIRVPLNVYEGLRYLEYHEKRGSIQEVAAELLSQAVLSKVSPEEL